jgi:hypothetical protein
MTVADYCAGMDSRGIVVNREYQRSDKVWPDPARSYLIESIVLGYPVPKLSLYQITDLKSRKTVKEIVDGQQRSTAIHDFFHDRLALARSLDTQGLAGRKYSELEPELQRQFLDFSLSLDLFVSATREEIVEVFRRINSYTIPLNPEEHRHAIYQGQFKWFINRISKRFASLLLRIGLFSEKSLVRMADAKLFVEVCDALLNGIRTTNKRILDGVYSQKDKQFAEEKDLLKQITDALDQLAEWPEIHKSVLMRPYVTYSLLLALTHMRGRVSTLEPLFPSPRLKTFDKGSAIANLSLLSEALENPDESAGFKGFIAACSGKTNTKQQRETRFKWM